MKESGRVADLSLNNIIDVVAQFMAGLVELRVNRYSGHLLNKIEKTLEFG